MQHWVLVLALFPLLGGSLLWSAEGEEDVLSAEAEQAAKEDEQLRAQGKIPDEGHELVLQGKYLITPSQEGNRTDIPGVFVVSGRAYHVKLMNEGLRGQLAKFNGKLVTLGGKIRNQGKYFIVQEVLSQPDGAFVPAQAHTARGRL